MKYITTFLLFCFGGVMFYYFIGETSSDFSYFDAESNSTFIKSKLFSTILGYIFLVTGIILGTWCRALIKKRDAGQEEIVIKIFFKRTFRSIHLWISLIGSPLIYGVIVSHVDSIDLGSYIFLALQTGFSSYIVIDAIVSQDARTENETAANIT